MVEIKDFANISKFDRLDRAPPKLLMAVVISAVDFTLHAKFIIV
jgi:hypothetical protein